MNGTVIGIAALLLTVTTMTFWIRALRRVAVPENNLGYVLAFLLAATLAIVSLSNNPGWIGGTASVFSVLVALFFMGTKAIGRQIVRTDAIQVGSVIPEFVSVDEHGKSFNSQTLAGSPVLIKFFRGHW